MIRRPNLPRRVRSTALFIAWLAAVAIAIVALAAFKFVPEAIAWPYFVVPVLMSAGVLFHYLRRTTRS